MPENILRGIVAQQFHLTKSGKPIRGLLYCCYMEFNADFFAANRRRLIEMLPDSLIVIGAHKALQESADLAYPFRQDSNFWYLTGINQSDLILLLDTTTKRSTLLVRGQNEYQKEWDGEVDTARLKAVSGITNFVQGSDPCTVLKQLKKPGTKICYLAPLPEIVEPYGFFSNPARRLLETEIKKIEPEPKDVRMELARLRQVKQPVELAAIREAIDVTGKALGEAHNRLASFKTEKELERAITAGFFANGSDGHAYEPIIASGGNAAIIHYNQNSAPIARNQLLLLDVGAKVGGYAADISRTWAIGKPTVRQAAVFEAVLRLQEKAFSLLKPGVIMKEYQLEMERHAAQELEQLGIKQDRYPHGFSHFLGLDVHDAGDYQAPLAVGSVLTVEPGIYLPDEGIGVRLEDNVLITDGGIENLSAAIPKTLL